MQWAPQVANCLSKSTKALNAIKLIKRYFSKKELLQLITSNVFSIMYYNSEIWHLPTLNLALKRKLFSASAGAIKTCMYYPDPMLSFDRIHSINKRASPDSYMKYNLAIQLFKLYNSNDYSLEWLYLNEFQILSSRQTHFGILKSSNLKVGQNALSNRLWNQWWHSPKLAQPFLWFVQSKMQNVVLVNQ